MKVFASLTVLVSFAATISATYLPPYGGLAAVNVGLLGAGGLLPGGLLPGGIVPVGLGASGLQLSRRLPQYVDPVNTLPHTREASGPRAYRQAGPDGRTVIEGVNGRPREVIVPHGGYLDGFDLGNDPLYNTIDPTYQNFGGANTLVVLDSDYIPPGALAGAGAGANRAGAGLTVIADADIPPAYNSGFSAGLNAGYLGDGALVINNAGGLTVIADADIPPYNSGLNAGAGGAGRTLVAADADLTVG
ncbi:hypothetical protein BaRGS_00002819, partial [Batillaria attramentaria]